MKKLAIRVGLVLLLVVLAAAGYLAYRLQALNTPEGQAAILARTREALGADVRVTKMDVSLFSGVTLEGVTIANPTPFEGDLLAASSFVLRYRLWPLLAGRLEVERAAFARPQLNLSMDARGRFNYEGLGAPVARRPGAASRPPAATTGPPEAVAPDAAAAEQQLPVDLRLRSVTVEDGTIVMRDATKAVLLRADDADLDSRFDVTSTGIEGSGRAEVGVVTIADWLFLRSLSAPLRVRGRELLLSPVAGQLAEGRIGGEVRVDLRRFRYSADVKLEGASVSRLLEEAQSSRVVSGKLNASATLEGSGGLATVRGKGRADVGGCRISEARVLQLLSRVLQLPELANPDFDRCSAEFTLSDGRLHTPVLRLEGRQMQLTGRGNVNLLNDALDYEMTLALAQPIFRKLTARELRAAFKERPDGFAAVDFRVTGTTTEPRTDLVAKVGRAAVMDAIRGGLDRLFGRKKKQQ